MPFKLARLARMDADELSWRSRTAVRAMMQRGAAALRPIRWHRGALLSALASDPSIDPIREALRAGDWLDAHRRLSRHLARRPSTFVITPMHRDLLRERILTAFRPAAADAAVRADRVLRGEYDVLGYRGLVFQEDRGLAGGSSLPDWHYDPVHHRQAPRVFWTEVPFLDPSCGDHKIIWELNRHQHWLALGRAYWLTGQAAYRERCLLELGSWLEANPPRIGINWASMLELAFRSLSWIWALFFFAGPEADSADRTPWTLDLLGGLDRQLTHIEQNLSRYFSPNTHLLGEALALYVAGRSLPELAASARRADLGRRILVEEIARQVGRDGGHCERSTHYHRYALDFYAMALTIARITRDPIGALFERTVYRLASAARLLCDDWGRPPHLGDDDGGALLPITGRPVDDWSDSLAIAAALTSHPDLRVGPPPEEAFWMLAHAVFAHTLAADRQTPLVDAPTLRSAALPDTGYYVSRSATGEHIVIDGGPHGYENGGHAHADALALTMSVRGRPFLIDPGTACYTVDSALRDRFRSTAFHNTLTIDGRPQSIPASPFQWLQITDATVHRWRTAPGFDYFDGSHHAYAPMTHRRRVLALHGDVVIVADHLDEPVRTQRAASVYWHVDPAWTIDVRGGMVAFQSNDERAALLVPQGRVESFVADADSGLGWHSPVYGRVEAASTIRISQTGAAPIWLISVFDLNPADPLEGVAFLPIWAEAGTMRHGTGLRLARRGSVDFALFAEPAPLVTRQTWRVAEFESDAHALFCHVNAGGEVTRLAMVDGSFARGTGRRAISLTLGQVVSAIDIDESSIRKYTPCAASPAL